MESSSWSILSTAAAGTVAVAFTLSWFTKSLLAEPINVKIIPEPKKKKRRKYDEDPEPELLKDHSPWGQPAPGSPSAASALKVPSPPPLRYGRYDQIWDPEQKEYIDFTAPPPRRVIDDEELLHWFKVYTRRQTTKRDEKPIICFEFISQSLIRFLRTAYGGNESFDSRPLIDVHQLFPLREKFSDLLRRMDPSKLQAVDFASKQALADSVGVPDAFNDDMDEPSLLRHFQILSRQLGQVADCLNKEFEQILEELAMYLSHGQIAFHLLGYMHKVGTKLLLHDSTGTKLAMCMTSSEYKLTQTAGGRSGRSFVIRGTGREWNGVSYDFPQYSRTVSHWVGARNINSLPWSVLGAEDEKELTERGRIYCQYSGIYHVYNKALEGRAMIDCIGYYNHSNRGGGGWGNNPASDWGNNANNWGNNENNWVNNEVDWGNNANPGDQAAPAWGNTGPNDIVSENGQENDTGRWGVPYNAAELPDEDLFLLPTKVLGFMLRTKKWVKMHISDLEPVKFDRYAWDHLVLDPDTKLLIRSLVDITCKGIGKNLIQDVITGKGGGLVSVLHGKPGTGKTLTVEAVAEHLERPIYIVGSEELPLNAPNFETSLRDILDLAGRWDAVLLIDEADVFLEQRSMHELARNAVVSVALRLLEYHSGVLFLTTNRIQAFDEAFLSRFSIGIKYPDLDQSSRLKIWKSFLRLSKVEVVDQEEDLALSAADGKSRVFVNDLNELAAIAFNGRSIKNLLRTSQALALAKADSVFRPGSDTPLSIEHLRIVVKTSQRFLRDFDEIEGPGA